MVYLLTSLTLTQLLLYSDKMRKNTGKLKKIDFVKNVACTIQ